MLANRRRSDAQVPVVHLQADAGQRPRSIRLRRVELQGDAKSRGFRVREIPVSELPAEALIIVDLGDGTALAIEAADIRTLSGTGARERFEDAAAAAATQGERRQRERERFRRASNWMLLVEQLNRTATRQDVFDVLVERVVELVDAHAAMVYAQGADAAGLGLLPAAPPVGTPTLGPLPFSLLGAPFPLQLLRSECEAARSGPRAALWPLFDHFGAASLALSALGEGALLVVLERRANRLFNGEDWFVLRNVAAQASMALRRVTHQGPEPPVPPGEGRT